jgi:hypothetical protein
MVICENSTYLHSLKNLSELKMKFNTGHNPFGIGDMTYSKEDNKVKIVLPTGKPN